MIKFIKNGHVRKHIADLGLKTVKKKLLSER